MKSRRIRPIKAYKHFRKLVANKEDTTQVFYIVEALDGDNLTKDFKKFMKTPKGQKRFNAQKELCLLYTSPSPRDLSTSRMPSSA